MVPIPRNGEPVLQFGKTIFNILLRLISKWRVLTQTNVTPYKHITVYHNTKLELIETFNGIKQFTGQGVDMKSAIMT